MRWDTTSRKRGGSLLLNSINLVFFFFCLFNWNFYSSKIMVGLLYEELNTFVRSMSWKWYKTLSCVLLILEKRRTGMHTGALSCNAFPQLQREAGPMAILINPRQTTFAQTFWKCLLSIQLLLPSRINSSRKTLFRCQFDNEQWPPLLDSPTRSPLSTCMEAASGFLTTTIVVSFDFRLVLSREPWLRIRSRGKLFIWFLRGRFLVILFCSVQDVPERGENKRSNEQLR